MRKYRLIKEVRREYADKEKRNRDRNRFLAIGGQVLRGGVTEDWIFWWEGTIRVDDDQTHVTGDFFCGRCAGTGAYVTMVENGVPKGPGGICYRCGGKGQHNLKDRKRNLYHDMHHMARGIV